MLAVTYSVPSFHDITSLHNSTSLYNRSAPTFGNKDAGAGGLRLRMWLIIHGHWLLDCSSVFVCYAVVMLSKCGDD
ncbi:hypothetical protein QC761_207766 [Podospora bellae-mahoneyi]|uniref:Uncharacterized protein n=1 Tax=Podospora bellae-mahoneyi TaxID=2093777 RepID=A0ABR0FQB0_9PEZI|nr:hypothetical protein QC761_207766 [Podospora bellae-mahoneyi]